MNDARAAGGGGGGIVLPTAVGAVKPVDVAGAWCCRGAGAVVGRCCDAVGARKVTEAAGAAGRVAVRAGGGLARAFTYVGGERPVVAFGRRYLRGGRAPLGVAVAEVVPEVGVSGVERGHSHLQRSHHERMLFFGHGGDAGVRCRTCLVADVRRSSCVGEARFHGFQEDGGDPGSEGGL